MSAAVPDSPIINFLPYQRAWLTDQARFKIGMFTRRGGKTFGSCGEIVSDCCQAEMDKRKVRWTILSRSENTAKEALEDALKPMTRAYYAVLQGLSRQGQPQFVQDEFVVHAHAKEVRQGDQTYVVDVPEARYKTQEVHFPGGSRVVALSASPDAARGFGGNLLLDEFAFHADSRRIWGSAYPVAARGGHKIRVISTPNGKGNKFYELMTTQDNGWSKHHVDIYEAVKQGLDVNIDELRAVRGRDEADLVPAARGDGIGRAPDPPAVGMKCEFVKKQVAAKAPRRVRAGRQRDHARAAREMHLLRLVARFRHIDDIGLIALTNLLGMRMHHELVLDELRLTLP
jgi:phage FluMu gp28-like protein